MKSFFDHLNDDDHSGDVLLPSNVESCDGVVRLNPPLVGSMWDERIDLDDVSRHVIKRVARVLQIDPERIEGYEMCDHEDVFFTLKVRQ